MQPSELEFFKAHADKQNDLANADYTDDYISSGVDMQKINALCDAKNKIWRTEYQSITIPIQQFLSNLGLERRKIKNFIDDNITQLQNTFRFVSEATDNYKNIPAFLNECYSKMNAQWLSDLLIMIPQITQTQIADMIIWACLLQYANITQTALTKMNTIIPGDKGKDPKTLFRRFCKAVTDIENARASDKEKWENFKEIYIQEMLEAKKSDEEEDVVKNNDSKSDESIKDDIQPNHEIISQPAVDNKKSPKNDTDDNDNDDDSGSFEINPENLNENEHEIENAFFENQQFLDSDNSQKDSDAPSLKLTIPNDSNIPKEIDNQFLRSESNNDFEHQEEENESDDKEILDEDLMQDIKSEQISGFIGDMYVNESRDIPPRQFDFDILSKYDDALKRCFKVFDKNALSLILYAFDAYESKSVKDKDFIRIAHDVSALFCKMLGFKTGDLLSSQLSLPNSYIQKFKQDFKNIYSSNPMCNEIVKKICCDHYCDFDSSVENSYFKNTNEPIGYCGEKSKEEYDAMQNEQEKNTYKNYTIRQNLRSVEAQNHNHELLEKICQQLMHTFYKTYKALNIAVGGSEFNIFSISQNLATNPRQTLENLVNSILSGKAKYTKSEIRKLSNSVYTHGKLKFASGLSDGVIPNHTPYLHKLAFRYSALQDKINASNAKSNSRKTTIQKSDDLRLLAKNDNVDTAEFEQNQAAKNNRGVADTYNQIKQGKLKIA